MEEVEIPQYFLCPISLMIMKDPVTTVTGITYDRESIEMWLLTAEEEAEEEAEAVTCPVTKQKLPRDTELLTPNHMLRRLIQAWCIANASKGIDRIPTPKYPLDKSHMLRLVRQVNNHQICIEALRKIEALVIENEKNKKCLEEVGAIKAMVSFIVKSFKEKKLINGLEHALRIFHLVWSPTTKNEQLVKENHDLIEAILWILRSEMMNNNQVIIKTHAMMVLKNVIEISSSNLLSGLQPEFFQEMVNILRKESKHHISQQATKVALQVLIDTCPWGRNKHKIIESGAIFELIELELCNTEKRVSELIFCILAHLCTCADGRAEFLKHAAGISVITKRTLRVSSTTDDCAIQILGSISKFSATKEVLIEMLRVGAVSKLCMVIQADCEDYLKKKAMEILRTHSYAWGNSPCIQIHLLT
ncbi:E3 ubiquitin-protein ligase PUB23-like [Nicotiana tabacum]|uniref:U-box domain-containing protein n=2 Tax=Nicotiana TaxID=4085 RepID=A0A1S4DIK8_TOBAC|nr:PREDICTED: E3 ubiquitin-protein ligase PUB23-like [Nicotiana sylvestris]XP_016513223.1 PREDICTED: E3 ubiquitin-protein ligase PUB23-like [Nicotiana tabacum]